MDVQTRMSTSGSRQVPNQAAQLNWNHQQPSGQNTNGGARYGPYSGLTSRYGENQEIEKARKFMLEHTYAIFATRCTQPMSDLEKKNCVEIVKFMEDMLFKSARNLEEYLDLNTLEERLQYLTKLYTRYRSQRQQHINSSSSIGTTMIPTPGMSHYGSSVMINMRAIDASAASTINSTTTTNPDRVSTEREHSMARQGEYLCTFDGFMSDGIQQSPANYSMASAGNHLSSVVGQRMSSHLIHTPRIIVSNSQSLAGLDPSKNCIFSTVESALAMQQLQQKQYAAQNSSTMHSLSSHMGNGIGSALMHKPHRLSDGRLYGELGLMGNNLQLANCHGTSENFVGGTSYSESVKTSSLQLEHNQRPLIEGDGNGTIRAELSGPGNLVTAPNSVRSILDNGDPVNLQTVSKANSTLINNQSNFNLLLEAGHVNPNVEEMTYRPSLTSREGVVQSSQQHCFQQQPHRFQAQHQYQLKKQSQHDQIMLENEALNQTQLGSNLCTQVNSELGMEYHYVDRRQQVPEQFLPDNQNQLGCVVDGSRAAPLLPTSINQHNAGSNFGNLQYMHSLNVQRVPVPKSDYNTLPAGAQPEAQMENQTQCQPVLCVQVPQNISHEQHVQEDFHQRISGQDDAQPNRLSSDSSTANQSIVSSSTAQFSNSSGTNDRDKLLHREKQNLNQRRWLLFLNHARHCRAPEGECQEPRCIDAQKLLKHMRQCGKVPCSSRRCYETKKLLNHFNNCNNSGCPVCFPVRDLMRKKYAHYMKANGHQNSENTSARLSADPVSESLEVLQPPSKRLKTGQPHSPFMEEVKPRVSASYISDICVPQNVQKQDHHHAEASMAIKSTGTGVKFEASVSAAQENASAGEMDKDTTHFHNQMPNGESNELKDHNASVIEENIKVENESNMPEQENVVQPTDNVKIKSGKRKNNGWASLTELFNPDQVREHVFSLRQWIGQSKAKAEKNQAMGHSMNENSCQLCGIEKLAFAPPPIYCATCGVRIKRNATYYTGEARQSFCIHCHNESRGETIVVDGVSIAKARLQKKKNNEETEEWWVQCDKCEAWQHQICALFNGKQNDGGQAEYTCANCYLAEVENGKRQPLPQSAVLGAKDLPKSKLSKHLEERVIRRLKEDRDERARLEGKRVEEVPSAEELVIRVVSSVDKKLEVKTRFLDIFREENFPADIPYKSKVVLLFQWIEGVEVCLFGMYLQEFGSECSFPNKRRVYLSYLDSVRYFRPEVKAASGEALRTFVYHEILIGYLEYCKMRGFTSCYIWACPPLKGEDYILYCHPEIQRTPKSDKLRDWYLSMLRKASRDNIVVELTNLYDHFFVQMGERRAKVTASRLPYFDGDYWPGAAEDLIYQMQQEVDGIQPNRKGSTKKTTSKRALKASGLSVLSSNTSKDLLLMHKLGETICPMKEDFIMVHLQHSCKHCCVLMVSGMRWVCQQCKNFQLCDECYGAEKNREYRERHPVNQKEKHTLFLPIQITDVPSDTKDEDEILESEFFDTRLAFLSLCQGNHYQYDTLRRAKHSSMMVLYHLHNPTAPAFVTLCKLCHLDIEAGQGWRCEVCPDFDVCNACYQSEGVIKHPHKLTNSPAADHDGQNKEARQQRIQQLRIMLDLLVHVSECCLRQCLYTNCRKVKGLFHHGTKCKVRLNGGCSLCKRMWHLLTLHARNCKESKCRVPRCQDLKNRMRRLQQQSESRRRAAVDEWSRMRAVEISSNNG